MENNRYILVCALVALLLSSPAQGITLDEAWCFTKTYGGAAAVGVGTVGAVAAAPAVLGAVGFLAGGTAAGSVVTSAMAMSAAPSGWDVVPGVIAAFYGSTYRYWECLRKKKEEKNGQQFQDKKNMNKAVDVNA